MPLVTFGAGSRVSAAQLNEMQPLSVVKSADESVTSSTTLQADNALFLPVLAAATYDFRCFLSYEGATRTDGDLKWTWTVPSGATLSYLSLAIIAASGDLQIGPSNEQSIASTVCTAATNGAGVLFGAVMTGSLVISATAGTLQLNWAQNTSSATPTIVHATSILTLIRNS